ncbi:MAG: hypothetical protein AB7O73_04560 [Bacteroidia bacterium]
MSKITVHNYEAYLLDYLEGNLNEEDKHELEMFSMLHPELEIDLTESLVSLEEETINFQNKQNLKVEYNEELVIGLLENKLEKEERQTAEDLLKSNMQFQSDYKLYQKTIVKPNLEIVFDDKNNLKKKTKIILFESSTIYRIAAGLILLAGFYLLFNKFNESNVITDEVIAKKENVTINELASDSSKLLLPNLANENVLQNEKQLANKQNTKQIRAVKNNSKQYIEIEKEPDADMENIAAIDTTNKTIKKIIPEIFNETKNDSSDSYLANNNLPENKLVPKYSKLAIETGYESESMSENKNRGRVWTVLTKTFKFLNNTGVKRLNSSENESKLVIGSVIVSKN